MTSKEIAERWFTPAYVGGFKGLVADLDRLGFIADIDAAIAEAVKATAEKCAVIAETPYRAGPGLGIAMDIRLAFGITGGA